VWSETKLFSTLHEGPIVVKTLLKIEDNEFKKLKGMIQQINHAYDTEHRYPNFLKYYEESRLWPGNGRSLVMLRQLIALNLNDWIGSGSKSNTNREEMANFSAFM